jgi:hypothetical protein
MVSVLSTFSELNDCGQFQGFENFQRTRSGSHIGRTIKEPREGSLSVLWFLRIMLSGSKPSVKVHLAS